MTLLKATIIAPDMSHWADWIDAAIKPASPKRQVARDLHWRLLDQTHSFLAYISPPCERPLHPKMALRHRSPERRACTKLGQSQFAK